MALSRYEHSILAYRIEECHVLDDVQKIKFDVKRERPPNFEAIEKVFPNAGKFDVLFTYGHVIYNPSNVQLRTPLVAHECTHMLQQDAIGGPEQWWEFYFSQPEFRLLQELDAYRIEYRQHVALGHPRHERKQYCHSCAERLSGPLYNNMLRRRDAQKLLEVEKEYGDRPRGRLQREYRRSSVAAGAGAEHAETSGAVAA